MDAQGTECSGILLVEDDHEIRRTLADVLRDEGYQVKEAPNGSEALAALQTAGAFPKPPCVILLDLMMPVMDGWQFRDAQLKDSRLTEIPVIVLTADGNARQKAVAMKASLGLTKPVKLDSLLTAIAQFC
jgi:CheY-like chemotaxis protein